MKKAVGFLLVAVVIVGLICGAALNPPKVAAAMQRLPLRTSRAQSRRTQVQADRLR